MHLQVDSDQDTISVHFAARRQILRTVVKTLTALLAAGGALAAASEIERIGRLLGWW